MRVLKTLISTAALLAGMTLMPAAQAQISINIGIQPTCSYGYYGYAPYSCAPMGYYGPGYFYNGIFVGMGPWAGWGYGHGWGGHRFVNDGGGRYHGGVGRVAYGGSSGGGQVERSGGQAHTNGGDSYARGARPNQGNGTSHDSASRGGGGQSHGNSGGQSHGKNDGQAHGDGGGSHGGDGHDGGDHK
jgi:hypothetical protein